MPSFCQGHLPLHSILVIFQFIRLSSLTVIKPFTFHSGYIPIVFNSGKTHPQFSLHSILVIFQSRRTTLQTILKLPLHSILVIFQLFTLSFKKICTILYIPFWLYSNLIVQLLTFQAVLPLHSILVIFQFNAPPPVIAPVKLYIPFWLYSNKDNLL